MLLDGDPTGDIADIRRVALVLTQGAWLSPRELDAAIGVVPFVAEVPVVRMPPRGTASGPERSSTAGGAAHAH